jgi:DNA-binding transcriptional ArsR family regulator
MKAETREAASGRPNIASIRGALGGRRNESAASWRAVRRLIARLSDAELVEAESIERLGRRRMEILRMITAEQRRRAGVGSEDRVPTVEAFL